MISLQDIKPDGRPRVIDLVRQAGVDVSDWARFARGRKWAAANPKYCYEWAFQEPNKVVVLNLWYRHLTETDGAITWTNNVREWFGEPRFRGTVSKQRSGRFDHALKEAARGGLPVRVIITDGRMRDRKDPKSEASSVERRILDPVPWAIESYDWGSGRCTLKRGASPRQILDSGAGAGVAPVPQSGDGRLATGPTTGPRPQSWSGVVGRNAAQPAFTYAFQFGKRDLWKIGHATDVNGRLTEVNTHVPHEVLKESWHVVLHQSWPTEAAAHEMEQRILKALRNSSSVRERLRCTRRKLRSTWKSALTPKA